MRRIGGVWAEAVLFARLNRDPDLSDRSLSRPAICDSGSCKIVFDMLPSPPLWGVADFRFAEAPASTYSASPRRPGAGSRPGWRDHWHAGSTQVGQGLCAVVFRPIVKARTLMNVASTALLALAMSTDAFAAAVGKGATLD